MLTTDANTQFEDLKTSVLDQIQRTFPIADRRGGLEIRARDVTVADNHDVDDIKGAAKARNEGKTWAVPVKGTLEVVDKTTGKVLLTKPDHTFAQLPKMTRHSTYIIGGSEKTVANQWRLRPGVYVKATERQGEFEAQFQLAKGKPFDLQMDAGGKLILKLGAKSIPAYAVMHGLGVSDNQLRTAWGDKVLEASKAKVSVDKALRSFYSGWKGDELPQGHDPAAAVKTLLTETRMDPVIAHANLGVEHDHVSPDVLLRASKKLVDVSAQRVRPDPIDSLRYKELWTAADQFAGRIQATSDEAKSRVQKTFEKPKLRARLAAGDTSVVRELVPPDTFQRAIAHVFPLMLTSNGKQTNPVSMLSDRGLATIMGPGGIQNEHQLNDSNKAVDPSHLGFVDPVFTPESNAGVTTHLAAGVRVKDRKPVTRLYNVRTGQMEDVDAARAAAANVVLPDQVKWKDGKPLPAGAAVRMTDHQGDMRDDIPWSKADYVIPNAAQVFSTETNLVPFMQNDSAGRTTMSARHMAQAISIVGREPPLVQTEAGAGHSFEQVVGSTFLAHKAPVDGVVKAVKSDEIVIQGKDGKEHSVHLYDHYPLNHDKSMLHSTPHVQPGDSVKAGHVLADNNFTKDGTLALGTNLRVAYLADGFNHEDGITISESAAKKLSSEHLYKPSLYVSDNFHVGKSKFLYEKRGVYEPHQIKDIGDDGIIKPGSIVKPGAPLILALSESSKPLSVGQSRQISRKMQDRFSNSTLVWDSQYEGEVVRVNKKGDVLEVHVKTREPAQVGSKLSTRHSAKGIVTRVLEDAKMPHDDKGRHVEMLINPVSVPGRMNPGQILETAAGKIAEATGKPYVTKNFAPGTDYLKKVEGELKKHGLKDTETLFDPATGRKLGEVMTGPHYVFQLEHQIDKKTHVRSGGVHPALKKVNVPVLGYDNETRTPKGGGHHGAQSLGLLGTYGALAAGLRDNLREMQTLKSDRDQAMELWGALANGVAIPAPKVPFAYHKFENMLRGLGVNVEKEGFDVRLVPTTDAETRNLSRGELKNPTRTVRAKDDEPEKGGLFDRVVTGGPNGTYWGHIELAEPMPHPIHSSLVAQVLGIKATDVPAVLSGEAKLPDGTYGGTAIKRALQKIDVKSTMADLKKKIDSPSTRGAELNKANRLYKSLQVLEEKNLHPADAWTIQAVPVMPPVFRPQGVLPNGTVKVNPLNTLYRRLGMVNDTIKAGKGKVPYNATLDTRAALYQELQNLFGTTPKGKKALDLDVRGTKEDPKKQLPGILHMISGDKPKDGYFQDKLLGKKQDYTARITIVADPGLSADEIGMPKKVALELFRPMVARRLQLLTSSRDPLVIHDKISKKDPLAIHALEKELEQRPVLLKRDPVLHQYGIIGQKVRLTDDAAVKVSPLVLPPLGGDIDGDTVAISVPITAGAVEEAKRVMPSNRMLSGSSGDVLFKPANEAALSLYRMTIPRGDKSKTVFKNAAEAEKAFYENKIDLNNLISIEGIGKTTLGRVRIANVIPEEHRQALLTQLDVPFTRKMQDHVLGTLARANPSSFLKVADDLTRVGFKMAYESGHTVGLEDLKPLSHLRDPILSKAESEAAAHIRRGDQEGATKVWLKATEDIHKAYEEHYKTAPTNVSDMRASGIKAKKEQFQGLLMAPVLVENHLGQPSKVPIKKSFSEGLDVGGYFMQASGARRGIIQKTESTAEPGYFTKQMVWAVTDQPIAAHDCGTENGIRMSTKDKDVVDRHLAVPTKLGDKTFAAGTVVTPEILSAAERAMEKNLVVRSPLKCRLPHGVCSKCMGVHPSGKEYDVGTNVGIIAAQALGERAAQIMLKQTHGGGIVSTAGSSVDDFGRVQKYFAASKPSVENAILAPADGTVRSVEKTNRGGWDIHIAGRKNPLYSRQEPYSHVKAGYQVRKGEQLTGGEANVHHILETQGLDAVQHHLTKEIGQIYGNEGVLRRHVELMVRNATGAVKVTDPGDHGQVLRGDYLMKPVVDEINRTALKDKKPIRYESELISLSQRQKYLQPDWMARLQGEQLAREVVTAAQQGQRSRLVGGHPIPALAHGATFGRSTPT